MTSSTLLPLVSIVMPSFNQGRFIEAAVASVLSQSWVRLELIVQDGGSTDGTLAILERISQQDARLSYVSMADAGPAQALNRAFSRVKGTIIGWLNSDDLYTPGAIERAVRFFETHSTKVLVYGNGANIDVNGDTLGAYPTLPAAQVESNEIPSVESFIKGCFISQPTVFFKRTVLTLIGALDEQLKASFDMDYWIRAFKAFNGRIGFLTACQAKTRLYEGTITSRQRCDVAVEGAYLSLKYFGVEDSQWLTSYLDEQPGLGLAADQKTSQSRAIQAKLSKLPDKELSRRLAAVAKARTEVITGVL